MKLLPVLRWSFLVLVCLVQQSCDVLIAEPSGKIVKKPSFWGKVINGISRLTVSGIFYLLKEIIDSIIF